MGENPPIASLWWDVWTFCALTKEPKSKDPLPNSHNGNRPRGQAHSVLHILSPSRFLAAQAVDELVPWTKLGHVHLPFGNQDLKVRGNSSGTKATWICQRKLGTSGHLSELAWLRPRKWSDLRDPKDHSSAQSPTEVSSRGND